MTQSRVSRAENRLRLNVIDTTTGESKKIETEMPKANFVPQNDTITFL